MGPGQRVSTGEAVGDARGPGLRQYRGLHAADIREQRSGVHYRRQLRHQIERRPRGNSQHYQLGAPDRADRGLGQVGDRGDLEGLDAFGAQR
jgi:hypothetical protein